MKKQIKLTVGSVIGWYGKKYKVVPDGNCFGCERCALYDVCNEIPFHCSSSEGFHFERVGGSKK